MTYKEHREGWPTLAITIALLVLLGAVLFIPQISPNAVLDDSAVYAEHPIVRANGSAWWTAQYYADLYRPIWRPLATLSLHMNWLVAPGSCRGASLVNLALLLIVAILSVLFMRRIGVGSIAAGAVMLIFLSHPAVAESVFRIAARGGLLAMLFMIVALLVQSSGGGLGRLIMWGLSLLAALASKEIALVLPFLALGYEWIRHQRHGAGDWQRRVLALLLITIVVAGSWGAFRAGVLRGWPYEITRNHAPNPTAALTDRERTDFAFSLPLRYGAMMIHAEEVLPDYSHLLARPAQAPDLEVGNAHSYGIGTPGALRIAGGIVLLGGFFLAAFLLMRRGPRLAFGFWWAAVTLLAALPLLGLNGHVASTQSVPLPLWGLLLVIAVGLDALLRGRARRAGLVVGGLCLVFGLYANQAATRELGRAWVTQDALVSHLEAKAPRSPEVPFYRAQFALARGDYEGATALFVESMVRFPRNPRALVSLSALWMQQGETSMGGRALMDATVVADLVAPGTAIAAQAHLMRGTYFGSQNLDGPALQEFLLAVAADSTNIHALARAGILEAMRFSSARSGIRHMRRAMELDRTGILGVLRERMEGVIARAEGYLRTIEEDETAYERMMNPQAGSDGSTQDE